MIEILVCLGILILGIIIGICIALTIAVNDESKARHLPGWQSKEFEV